MKGCAAKQRTCGECTGKEAELLEQQAQQRAKDRELKLAAEAAAAEATEKEHEVSDEFVTYKVGVLR